jgi:hypothetical protein
MASRGHRLGTLIAYDNRGLMHNLPAYLGCGNRKEHSATAEFGGATLPWRRLLLLCLVGVSLSARKPQY